MSFQTTALKYGWVYLTALGVITGTTIYVLNNTRQQVKPEDIIQIVLGVEERCLATQTSTNPTLYADNIWVDYLYTAGEGFPLYHSITSPASYLVNPVIFPRLVPKTNANAIAQVMPAQLMPDPAGWVFAFPAYAICYTTYWPDATSHVIAYTSPASPREWELNRSRSVNYASSWSESNGYSWTSGVFNFGWHPLYESHEYVTNRIGWHVDRNMMITLDSKIKALVPCYVDADTVYDGTTNIIMLTVTGLWASLGIGDKTNKFTREPSWTNPVSTNWVVNYTSYWPSTNGTATNICYTSDYRQVVNYAQSWTATGGHVWVASSNWASEVVTVTNVATYGDYPWQIYAQDLEERYKVLNALKTTKGRAKYNYRMDLVTPSVSSAFTNGWTIAKQLTETAFTNYTTNSTDDSSAWEQNTFSDSYLNMSGSSNYVSYLVNRQILVEPTFYCTNISILDEGHYVYGVTNYPYIVFDDNGIGIVQGQWKKATFPLGLNQGVIPAWCIEPTNATHQSRGVVWVYQSYPTWDFQYCTNKYW